MVNKDIDYYLNLDWTLIEGEDLDFEGNPYHYIEIKDDYSDLEEKLDYYSEHTEEALKIIENAHKFVAEFRDPNKEDLIALLVLKKYFELQEECK